MGMLGCNEPAYNIALNIRFSAIFAIGLEQSLKLPKRSNTFVNYDGF